MASLRRLSLAPGRARWRVEGLYRDASAADRLAGFLGGEPEILAVMPNHRTGRVLVYFKGPPSVADRIESLIRERIAPGHGQGARPNDARPGLLSRRLPGEARIGVVVSLAAAGASLTRLLFLGRTLDRLMAARTSQTGMIAAAGIPAVITFATGVAYISLKKRNSAVWSRLGQRRHYALRMEIARTLARADVGALDEMSATKVSNIVRSSLAEIERGFDGAGDLVYVGANTVMIGGAFLVLAPGLAWIPALALLAMAVEVCRNYLPVQRRYLTAGQAQTVADRELAELVDGLATVKSFGLEERKLASIEEAAKAYQDESTEASMAAARNPLRLEMITLFGVAAVTIGAGAALARGRMSAGTHLALMMLSGHLFYPFSMLGPSMERAHRGLAADRALSGVNRIPVEADADLAAPVPAGTPALDITLDCVDFRYPTGRALALRKASMRIPVGSFVGIVGSSGGGKSTIRKLLLRFYDPASGAIRVDGTDIRCFDRAGLRRLFTTIDQQSFLFEDTIARNISAGRRDADDASIRAAARASFLDGFIESLPDQYATSVGARGCMLSDGQRQRLLLARALLRPAPVLILDEATSNLDATTEQTVLSNIRALGAGRTVIVIAHRLTAVRNADTIFVLHGGTVMETGSHDELLRDSDGIYRSLWDSQHKDPISAM